MTDFTKKLPHRRNTNDRNGRMPVLEILLRMIDDKLWGKYQEKTQIFAILVLCEFWELSERTALAACVKEGTLETVENKTNKLSSGRYWTPGSDIPTYQSAQASLAWAT